MTGSLWYSWRCISPGPAGRYIGRSPCSGPCGEGEAAPQREGRRLICRQHAQPPCKAWHSSTAPECGILCRAHFCYPINTKSILPWPTEGEFWNFSLHQCSTIDKRHKFFLGCTKENPAVNFKGRIFFLLRCSSGKESADMGGVEGNLPYRR